MYDVTPFMQNHPGGEEILLQFGGQDVTSVMQDPMEHSHSDSAYEMIKEYYIGELEGELNSEISLKSSQRECKENIRFIDMNRPMLRQVWDGGFSKEFYLKQVHMPRHTKGTAPLIGGILEVFTKTSWWIIPIFWAPIICYCIMQCLITQTYNALYYLIPIGILSWTLIEYTLHRFLFHLDEVLPDHRIFITLHFLLHGVHHFLPMDR